MDYLWSNAEVIALTITHHNLQGVSILDFQIDRKRGVIKHDYINQEYQIPNHINLT